MLKKEKKTKSKLIGKVVHYFSKIGVAVVKVSGILKKGDIIRVVGGQDTDFSQKVVSMETDHKKIEKTKKGQEVGIKVKEKVREDYKVYKE